MAGGWDWDGNADDPVARREASNSEAQARRLAAMIREAVRDPDAFLLTLDSIAELNRIAIDDLVPHPGMLREDDLEIIGSRHVPPPWQEVAGHVQAMLDYVNERPVRDPLHLAAFVLWRINWIHPFENGNGRTARAVAYLLLNVGAGRVLPGEITVVERLSWTRLDYFDGLEAADRAWESGDLDVSMLEGQLGRLLREQLEP